MPVRNVLRPLVAAAVLAGAGLLAGCEDYPPPPPRWGPPPPPPGWRAHVRRCLYHHPSYDPRSNIFVGPDGYPHECRD